MPMRDSWQCDFAPGLPLRMNSAGSCDSVISINSGYSDDSMEHLSAEERACLMFLEETIESLETEDDSGVSNDEPDHLPHNLTNKTAHLGSVSQVKPEEFSVHGDTKKPLGKDHKSNKLLVPTPLVLANGNSKLLQKNNSFTNLTTRSSPNPGRHKPEANPYREMNNLPPSFIPEPPVRSDPPTGAPAKDNPPKSNFDPKPDKKLKSDLSKISMELLPPPSDFMDEPVLLPPAPPAEQSQPQRLSSQLAPQVQPQPCQSESLPTAPPLGFDEHIKTPVTSLSTSPRGHLSPNELDKLRKKASLKKVPEKLPVVQVKSDHNVSDQANSPTFGTDHSAVTGLEYGEPKSPPTVAPKPKKLPSSIVLKSHKDATPGHTLVSPGGRMMINKQKIHQEALKKLGLLKAEEINSGVCSSPPHKTPLQTSFNTSNSPDSTVLVHGDHQTNVEAQGRTYFSFLPVHPEKGERENLLVTRESPKPFEMKSASMERSGVGLKSLTLENPSHLTSQEESPENVVLPQGLQRNNHSRNASMDCWKDFSQMPSEPIRGSELRRSLPIPAPLPAQSKPEPQKPLRSHGISVVISPQSNNGEDRKQALRRLGLI
ncbi:specifically androgen-regulatedprotein-like, partial [Silurus asotus]